VEGPETDMTEVNKLENWLAQLKLLIISNKLDRNTAAQQSVRLSTLISEWNASDAFDTSTKSQISGKLNILLSDLKAFDGSKNIEIQQLVDGLHQDLEALKNSDKNAPLINSAEFAAQMIESGEAVRFVASAAASTASNLVEGQVGPLDRQRRDRGQG
jgi:hypothetical protein